jgi:hypothetical protein
VASDRDSQAVHIVQPNAFHCTGLSVGEDHGFADKLDLGNDRTHRGSWTDGPSQLAWVTQVKSLSGRFLHLKFAQVVTGARQRDVGGTATDADVGARGRAEMSVVQERPLRPAGVAPNMV